jgi:hypothetical protein
MQALIIKEAFKQKGLFQNIVEKIEKEKELEEKYEKKKQETKDLKLSKAIEEIRGEK